MEILGSGGVNRPMLPLDVELDTAFALYCEKRWPIGRRKAIEKEWDLSVDEARAVVEAKASKRIISKILKHPRGGWAVVLPVLGAVIGEPIDAFFRDQMKQAAREARQAHEHEQLAQAAYRRLESGPAASGEDRRSWPAPGEMGAEAARRLAGG